MNAIIYKDRKRVVVNDTGSPKTSGSTTDIFQLTPLTQSFFSKCKRMSPNRTEL
jgi:hypothetical protein